ncbi:RHS repeat-associated core domain-containing protein, partial [Elizabethkingia anophelis]|nr:RHS repeat-associated core domain-containing protein [Elizabethkingia anophelis]EJG2053266.1 RHS repeat-associated core domain-containing protein [Elizabethkingia anophelis]EJG2061869.1 RHS repeat-associated core domain-containing protein [Elizabethkingia anophelis]EJG2065541.1 RHS repeat-associated core domain-containing protein [Elizabethkingia anophelis]EJG2069339.1 RHS repeat-associated core domain-containing protein [Elizabethkingia anophelis]
GTYGASSLYKNVVTDEDGNSTIEFKNGQGQTVLVRKKNGSEDLDTYYVYNEYNQLAFVIPPLAVHKGVELALLNELAYQYRYDGQNRLVEKKLPGKDWEYMVYDQQDRLVLTQDGKLRQQNKWLFTKYDKFGRVAYTGLLDSAPGRDAQQSNMVHFGGNNEERSASGFTQNGTTVYYSSSAYPVGNFTLLTVNYYDEYPPGSPGVFNGASVLGSVPVNGRSTKGLPVASMVKNIEDNGWTKSYTWYDDKARPVATESRNHLGGYTRTSSVLAFSGVPTSTTTYHKRDAASGEMVMKEDFSYDHQNRLVKHTHQVNGGPVEVLTENIYNELGQLESRNIGNGIQSIKNEYNIRGALTKMNDPKNLLNKLFGFELKYINPSGTSKKYNGNIAETDWATQSDGTLRRYSYQYDGVNRLKEGNYWDNAGAISGSYAERLNYDVNGNITGLQRTGLGAGVMDQLGYTYDQSGNSNKLIRVNDASGNAAGYPVGGNTIGYDINGNMVNHLDKGISNIAYNYLNLPSSITASMG